MSVISSQQIEQIRAYNRFYTRLIGLLNEGLFKSDFSLTEARIIYELGEVDTMVATQLGQALGLDAGYLSRILNKLIKSGIISRVASEQDKRQYLLSLSATGEMARQDLRQRSIDDIGKLFDDVGIVQSRQVVKAMQQIQTIISAPQSAPKTFLLRDPEVGDLSYITHRQAVLYNAEYGFDNAYEAVVSTVIGEYISNFNAAREKCWIAECEDEIIGSIFCVNGGNDCAKLRLLYVDPKARGMGVGSKLVAEVIKFARKKAYKKIEFWTVDCLTAARHLYEKAGFELVSTQPHTEFGGHLNGGKGINRQDWQMIL